MTLQPGVCITKPRLGTIAMKLSRAAAITVLEQRKDRITQEHKY